ncbi:MAG: hypothetical protein JXB00_18585 [Bacteroidales bacterium]|nr:hypothetical protein [Bacteroidales bacterium]
MMNKNKTIGRILISLVIFSSVIIYILGIYQRKELKKYSRYTIGYTNKVIQTTKLGKVLKYHYFINGEEYNGAKSNIKSNSVKLGERYYVIFSNKNPINSEIYLERTVPDSIRNAPSEGWEEIPK